MPAKRLASMVLPDPGGPTIRTWWLPRSDLECACRGGLAADITEVRASNRVVLKGVGRGLGGGEPKRLDQELHDFGRVPQTEDLNILDDGGLGGVLRWNEQIFDAALLCANGDG
jgi:hypothetical protein